MSTKATLPTPFQVAILQAEAGIVRLPSVHANGSDLDYFAYQLAINVFNLRMMAGGLKVRGITFTDIKKYYGLKGKSAKDCIDQLRGIQDAFHSNSFKN